jgi:hypothetical protein
MGRAAPTWTTAVPIDQLLLLRAAGLREDARPEAMAASPEELRRIAKDLDQAADASGSNDPTPVIVALALCVLCWLLAAVAVAAIA